MNCSHCHEVITGAFETMPGVTYDSYDATTRELRPSLLYFHPACQMRMIIGGLNHLQKRCTCCGGTEPPDPPDMSIREAAKAACRYWMETEW